MFFTQEDYKKIYNWIKLHSIKDSDFPDARPLDGRETVTIVQQGHNVKFLLRDFLEQLLLLNTTDFINVTERYNLGHISLFEAIKAIPYRSRKVGQVITFLNEDGNWKIYQFRGERKNQWNILTLWVDILQDIINKGNILPDEEDLTTVKEGDRTVVKFKDKPYNPDNFSGKGRVYLRKNITEVIDNSTKVETTKNLLTQKMLGKEDTVYIVQYDYDLNGQIIVVPIGSTLLFQGGSICNGTLKGSPKLEGVPILSNITVDNTINDGKLNTSWFAATDIPKLLPLSNMTYIIDNNIDLEGNTIILGENNTLDFVGGNITNGTLLSNHTKVINIPGGLDIIGQIYNSDSQEITIYGDVINRDIKLYFPWMPYRGPKSGIDTAIRNMRNIGITECFCVLHVGNDDNDNFFITNEAPAATTPSNLMEAAQRNNVTIEAIKFHTEAGFTYHSEQTVSKYCDFVYNYISECKEIGIKFNVVYIVNEEETWFTTDNICMTYVQDLADKIKALGYEPRIAYSGEWGMRNRLVKGIVPSMNFYPTISFLDTKAVYSDAVKDDIINFYFKGLFPIGGIYTLKDFGITELGCPGKDKGLRAPYYLNNEWLGNNNSYILYLYWKYMIEIFNTVKPKFICIWYVGEFDPANKDIDVKYCYNLFRQFK